MYLPIFHDRIEEHMNTRQSNIENIQKGLCTAFIDGTFNSNLAYKPEFVSNDYQNLQKKQVLK